MVGCKQDWTPSTFVNDTVKNLKKKILNDKVVLGLSGGVDSTVECNIACRRLLEIICIVFLWIMVC